MEELANPQTIKYQLTSTQGALAQMIFGVGESRVFSAVAGFVFRAENRID